MKIYQSGSGGSRTRARRIAWGRNPTVAPKLLILDGELAKGVAVATAFSGEVLYRRFPDVECKDRGFSFEEYFDSVRGFALLGVGSISPPSELG